MKKIMMVTGGTGGHIYPAISVAEILKKKNYDVVFIGSKYRMENSIVPENNFRFIGLPIPRLNRVRNYIKFLFCFFYSIGTLLKERPLIVFGFGNYTMIPIVMAAFILRIPIYLHEQNVNLGKANKLCYRFSKKIFLSFDSTYEKIPCKYLKKVKVVGNPVRAEFYNVQKNKIKENKKIDKDKKIILVMGGSLGAQAINDAFMNQIILIKEKKDLIFYWITGKNNFKNIKKYIYNQKIKNIIIFPYLSDIYKYMAISDLVICRSGASTLSELITLEKPSIMIPYDFVGQKYNANILKKIGGAYVYKNDEIEVAFEKALSIIENENVLKVMKDNIKKIKKTDVIEKILKNLDIWR